MAARVNELRQSLAEARKAAKELLDEHLKATQAEDRGFTDEEREAHKAAESKVKDLEELIQAEERRIELDKATAAPSRPAGNVTEAPPGRVRVSAPNVEDDPRRGFRSHRDFLLAAIANSGHRSRDQVGDERLQMLAVADREDRNAAGDLAFMLPVAFTPRFLATVGSDEQGEYDDRYGGFSVPKTFVPMVMSVGPEADPTAGRTQMVPMATPSVEIMARTDKDHSSSVSGGFTVTRRAEAAAASASRAQLEMITLKAVSLFGLAYATEELLQDSAISFVALIEAGFRDQFAHHMVGEKLGGGGGNEYLGVLTALSASSLGPTLAITKEASQTADTIVVDNVLKMRARCWGYGNAIWIANHDTYPQLAKLAIVVGTGGGPIYHQSLQEDRPDTLLGRPIFYSEYMETLGDQGDILIANFSQYLEGLYQPLQSAESVHVRFVNHERAFKFWLRNAGAPWWRTALTPKNSSSTLSPFVTLKART